MSFELYTKDGESAHPGNCKFCGGTDLVRCGTRKTKTGGTKQLWRCNDCMRRFSNTHRHGKHKDPEAVLRCLRVNGPCIGRISQLVFFLP